MFILLLTLQKTTAVNPSGWQILIDIIVTLIGVFAAAFLGFHVSNLLMKKEKKQDEKRINEQTNLLGVMILKAISKQVKVGIDVMDKFVKILDLTPGKNLMQNQEMSFRKKG